MDESIEVTIMHTVGAQGPGWYVWETEYPEEGYVYFSKDKPRIEMLRALVCSNYVEAE